MLSWLRANRWSGGRHEDQVPASLQIWAGREPGPQLRRAWPDISAEFERARRYERSVTVAVFAESGTSRAGGHNGNGHASPPEGASQLAGVLAAATREIDLVTCHADLCVVIMPEIGAEDGPKAVRRMREVCAGRLGRPVEAGIAVFPADGWVFTDLVDLARRNAVSSGGDERVDALTPGNGARAEQAAGAAQGT